MTAQEERRDGVERRVDNEPVADERRAAERRAAHEAEQRAAAERWRRVMARVDQAVDYVFLLLYGLLIVRFLLTLLGANEEAAFVQFIHGLTGPFYGPFSGIVARPAVNGGLLDFPLIIALLAYVLLHGAVRGLLRLLAGTSGKAVV